MSSGHVSSGKASPQQPRAGAACEVWFADLGQLLQAIEDEERRCPRLSDDEHLRAERIGDPDQRRLWRASHIALRDILERSAGPAMRGVPFAAQAGGRPELAPATVAASGEALRFSLSHTRDVALIAISRGGPVGVDIEAVHARAFPEARRNKIEAIAVDIAGGRALPDQADRRFLQAWTRVEAMSKADGRGVLYTLSSVGVREPGDEAVAQLACDVRDLDVGVGYCAAIAGTLLPADLNVKRYIPGKIQAL